MTSGLRPGALSLYPGSPGNPARCDVPVENAGLALSRYIDDLASGEKTGYRLLRETICNAPISPLYRMAFERWADTLARARSRDDPTAPTIETRSMKSRDRVIVGLGAESVRETSITLHRAHGMPYLPGSALKGLARRYASAMLPDDVTLGDGQFAAKSAVMDVLFGKIDNQGFIVFHDAWLKPPDTRESPFRPDVITVHHPKYYVSAGNRPAPWDLDDPNPTAFLSAAGTFLVAVGGPDAAWTSFALDLLCAALTDFGIGAKTSSGYGRLISLDAPAATSSVSRTADRHPLWAAVDKLDAMSGSALNTELGNTIANWEKVEDPVDRVEMARAIVRRIDAGPTPSKLLSKPYVLKLREFVAESGGA